MKTITQILTNTVSDAFESCGYDRKLGAVTFSDRMDLCQFQCNGAFSGAKLYRKAPFMIADEIAEVLSKKTEMFKKVESVKPGFLNIVLTDEFLVKCINEISNDENVGIPQAEVPQKIVIDYGGPNVAKPLHIGHLRSAIIGETLKRLARAMGNTVYGDVHLGDWGMPMGLVIAELNERNPEWKCFSEDFKDEDGVPTLEAELLNEIYPYASKKSKENEEFKEKAHTCTFELQNGRKGYIALWKEILRSSIADIKSNYDSLNVSFDYWYGESNADPYIGELMEILEEKCLVHESEGAVVIDVAEDTDNKPMPPAIIKKSDGSINYTTTDIATILQRQKDFAPDKIWYVVDLRQGLHFTQVFRCARKAELVPSTTELEFLGFGTMNGNDGKPYKTRDGGVMRLSALIDTVTQAAEEKLLASGFVEDENVKDTSKKVGIAALKFGDLINHRAKDYIFDMDKFLSFEGKTGTYLLYTVTRINSILDKVSEDCKNTSVTNIFTDSERELILTILATGDNFNRAMNEKAPNYICENAYQIASVFSKFYHDNHIASEEDPAKKASWTSLCEVTGKVLLKHLDVLGIEAVSHM